MFDEEKRSGGVLYSRTPPYDEFQPKAGAYADAVNALASLSCSERSDLARWFCVHCGTMQESGNTCQCWNDE